MRNERPNRTAGRSPECTMRYTVMFETRIISATSATVRKRTSIRPCDTRAPYSLRNRPKKSYWSDS
jgi:hypothetical protein